MRILSLFITLLLFSTFIYGQEGTIFGKVTDENGEPLVGASVIFRGDITRGVSTDFEGNYQFNLPIGERLLICRFTDMITDTITIHISENTFTEHNFKLKQHAAVKEFKEVSVTGNKFDAGIEDITVSLEVIKPEKLEKTNTRNITTILDQTPGLNIMDGEPQIRGGSGFTFGVGSSVTVFVDDIPMMSPDAGQPLWEFVPVENIKQVNVIKGAGSVLTGSSALSGAVMIYSKYPSLKPFTKVNIYTGMYNSPHDKSMIWQDRPSLIEGANFLHSQKFGNWDVTVGADVNYDEGYQGPPILDEDIALNYPDTISNFTNKQMRSYRGRVNFNIRRRSKKMKGLVYGLNGNAMYSISPMVYAWLNDTTGIFRGYPGATFIKKQTVFHLDPYVNLFMATGSKHKLSGRFLYNNNDITANQGNNAKAYYLDYQFQRSYERLAGLNFTGGVTGHYIDSYAEMYVGSATGSPYNNILNVSGYAELQKKFWKIVTLSLGGRLEYFNLNQRETELLKPLFRASGNIKLLQETYLRASYGQGLRFPTIAERFIQMSVGNFGVFSTPNLKPESSFNSEVGIKQGVKIGGVYGYIDVAGYWQEYENTIEYLFGFWKDYTPGGTPGAGFKFTNTGKSRVLGIDASFMGKADIGKRNEIVFLIGYNYILPKTLTPDYVYAIDKFPIQPNHYSYNNSSMDSSNMILKYRFLHNVKADLEWHWNDKIDIGVSMKYFSSMVNMDAVLRDFEEMTEVLTVQNIRYMDYMDINNKGKFIFDARTSYAFTENHKLTFVVKNFLNKTYSLRPLKIEEPMSMVLQYTLTL